MVPIGNKTEQSVTAMTDSFFWQETHVAPAERAALKRQEPRVIWFTGLSGSGKSTLANALEQDLWKRGFHTFLLDGDNVRHGLNSDLDLSAAGRKENIRRISEVCKLFNEAGIIVLTAFVSPYRADRNGARSIIGTDNFFEVYVNASLQSCTARDPKGLYAQARNGYITGMTGIDAPYEVPVAPEIELNTDTTDIADCISRLLFALGVSTQEGSSA